MQISGVNSYDSLLFKFIWKHKTEYVKRETLIKYSEGGFNVLDFQTISSIFKINWLKHCLAHNNSPCFFYSQLCV